MASSFVLRGLPRGPGAAVTAIFYRYMNMLARYLSIIPASMSAFASGRITPCVCAGLGRIVQNFTARPVVTLLWIVEFNRRAGKHPPFFNRGSAETPENISMEPLRADLVKTPPVFSGRQTEM